jgi:hypothetical protein
MPVDSVYFIMSNVHGCHLSDCMWMMTHQECCEPCIFEQCLEQVCRLLCVFCSRVLDSR